jgi:hypothetical protein
VVSIAVGSDVWECWTAGRRVLRLNAWCQQEEPEGEGCCPGI